MKSLSSSIISSSGHNVVVTSTLVSSLSGAGFDSCLNLKVGSCMSLADDLQCGILINYCALRSSAVKSFRIWGLISGMYTNYHTLIWFDHLHNTFKT